MNTLTEMSIYNAAKIEITPTVGVMGSRWINIVVTTDDDKVVELACFAEMQVIPELVVNEEDTTELKPITQKVVLPK